MSEVLTAEFVAAKLPKRPKDANKGTFGKVLVVAGSKNYPGAAYLSCAAAYRVGAGLVTLVTSPDVKIKVFRKLPEVTFLEDLKKALDYDVLLFGPGLGQDTKALKFINKFPNVVIDGDGLNMLARLNKWDLKHAILTPHPKEMSRLTNLTVESIQKDRVAVARKYAKRWGQVVVLKGANTVVASPTGEVKVSPFANPALATAGTGDILAGIIASMLAQGLEPFDAACAAVYIHGMAGDIFKEKNGDAGMLASDLLPLIPKVLLNISKHRIS